MRNPDDKTEAAYQRGLERGRTEWAHNPRPTRRPTRRPRRPTRPPTPFGFKVIFVAAVVIILYVAYLFAEPHIQFYRFRRHIDVLFGPTPTWQQK